jgi:N-acetylmuramoyl-L-alanine amidase
MPDDFDTYVKSALEKKQVPVQVVASRDEAEFEIKGTSETQKAGAAKKIFMGSWHSDEQASINLTELKSGEIVYAYSANKKNSAHGKQTSAEACAKHLKEAIEKGK